MRKSHTIGWFLFLLILFISQALLPEPAHAQLGPPSPAPTSVLSGQVDLNVTNSSARVPLPSTLQSALSLTIYNAGLQDAFYLLGNSSVTATTAAPSIRIPAGTYITVYRGPTSNTNIAAITSSSTTSLRIYQGNGPFQFGMVGGSNGGGGGAPSGPAGGDLTGTYPAPVVSFFNGGTPFGTAAGVNTGTAGATLGLLNGNLTFSGANAYGTPASITLTNGTGLVPSSGLAASGTPGPTTFLRGDNTWAVPSGGGGSGCVPAGSNTQALTDNGAGACSSDANATFVAGVLNLGASGTVGAVTLGNATSGNVKIQTVAGALGSAVASMPAGTYTVVGDGLSQTLTNKTLTAPTLTSPTVTGAFTATGLVTNADLANSTISGIALGSNLAALTATDSTLTFSGSYTGATARTVGLNLSNANTWLAVQTVTNDDWRLLGSSTGYLQFHSLGTTSSNFTISVPAVTDTLALAGIGATISSNGTTTVVTAPQFNNNFPLYTVNATTAEFDYPVASLIQASGGGMMVINPSANSFSVKPNGTDNLNGANSSITVPAHDFVIGTGDATSDYAQIGLGANLASAHLFVGAASGYAADVALSQDCTLANTGAITCTKTNNVAFGTAVTVNTGTSGATIPLLNGTNVWSGQQSNSITTLSISTATFTPTGANNNYKITLIHASCPCTLANPSATPVAGTSGIIEVIQSSTGSDTISTWGSQYLYAGGTSAIAFSAGANAIDFLSYYVIDSTHILLSTGALNATH